MMDASILLPPTGTPLTGIDFVKRLPCGDVEKTRRVSEPWTWPPRELSARTTHRAGRKGSLIRSRVRLPTQVQIVWRQTTCPTPCQEE